MERSSRVEGTPRGRRFALGLPAIAVFVCFRAASAVTIDWVVVVDPGNAADTTGHGAVADVYQIGKSVVSLMPALTSSLFKPPAAPPLILSCTRPRPSGCF